MREGEGEKAKWVWKPVTATGKAEEAEPLTVPVQEGGTPEPFTLAGLGEPPTAISQALTVTSEGGVGQRRARRRQYAHAGHDDDLFSSPAAKPAAT